jgi:hypothetical protein
MRVTSTPPNDGDRDRSSAGPGPVFVALAALVWAANGALAAFFALAFAGVGIDVFVPFMAWATASWLVAGALHFRPWSRRSTTAAVALSLATVVVVALLVLTSSPEFLATDVILVVAALTAVALSLAAARATNGTTIS